MDSTRVAVALQGIAMAVFAAFGVIVLPTKTQEAVVVASTLVAGWIAPSIAGASLKVGHTVAVSVTVILGLLAYLVAHNVVNQELSATIAGIVVAVAALFIPSTSHPSTLTS